MTPAAVTVREARLDDVPALLHFIRELADYEREPDAVMTDEGQLAASLFGPAPAVFAHVCEGSGPGGLAGMAIWFINYSTWTGRHGIWLEDLYVRPDDRRQGVARALFATLASLASERDYARIDWSVLDWNDSAIRFYQSLGAVPMDEWTGYRLTGEALAALGSDRNPR
jgi:GNAT superfamily N-acetyltransferase